ncbi:MAG: hypothetical protein GWN58_26945, partial [Anaerolineae bacterium]|nr:hypothetical protein [Anaerolineae bacterium]
MNPSISPRAAEATAEGTRGFAQWFQETFFPSGEDAPRTPAGDLSLATLALTGGDPQAEANRGLFPRAQEPGVAPDSGGILDETLDVGPNFVIREDGTRAAMFGESAPIKTQEDADARLADISRREMVVNAFENEFVMTPQSQAQVAQMREEL